MAGSSRALPLAAVDGHRTIRRAAGEDFFHAFVPFGPSHLNPLDRGRSTEAEIRDILDEAVRPKTRVKVGSTLAAFGRRFGGVNLEIARDQTPTEAAKFR